MAKFVIGRKSGMTQLFDENGNVIPATVIEVVQGSQGRFRRSTREACKQA